MTIKINNNDHYLTMTVLGKVVYTTETYLAQKLQTTATETYLAQELQTTETY